MKTKVLITGGAGFIGSNLSLKLIDEGYLVTVLDNLSPQVHGSKPENTSPLYNRIKDKVIFHFGDITSRKDVENAMRGQDIVVHLAAETGTGQSMYQIDKYTKVNIGGTSLLLDILLNKPNQIKKLVLASSRAVYGEGKYFSKEKGVVYPESRLKQDLDRGDFSVRVPGYLTPLKALPTDEDSKTQPTSVYGITKLVQEQLVTTVTKAIGIASVIFRYQNVYGPGQSLTNPYTGILSVFSTRIRNNRDIEIYEDGRESRDFVFVDDAVMATILGIKREEANGHIFNVGSGMPIDVLTVANKLITYLGVKVHAKISGNYRSGDIRHNFADIQKINNLLGFKPTVDFDDGISQFVEWVKIQDILVDNYQISIDELKKRNLFT